MDNEFYCEVCGGQGDMPFACSQCCSIHFSDNCIACEHYEDCLEDRNE